jgi:hypothetical protein
MKRFVLSAGVLLADLDGQLQQSNPLFHLVHGLTGAQARSGSIGSAMVRKLSAATLNRDLPGSHAKKRSHRRLPEFKRSEGAHLA